eukprot:CAMPEP_0194707282 /NCGR_PEP_ID=MMETSP0295-20121207/30060_1 /TAXON_ID=39354 /ORGANISM="Heterosigma akashiwo, Strain CCMP2393" /LENGTH=30 /DNA_ID= /DNA_START= /DNA_END= /DNA_ORIENTATION=
MAIIVVLVTKTSGCLIDLQHMCPSGLPSQR